MIHVVSAADGGVGAGAGADVIFPFDVVMYSKDFEWCAKA